jgi:rfaE bifunctional protein nucleotidyltransferase chain/domain
MKIIHTSDAEKNIIEKNIHHKRTKSDKKDYLNKLYNKPWGYEYLTYQTENIGIWILHINQNQKTSVHCHFNKGSMLIALSGSFRIDTYDSFYILNENEIMYFPANTFHGIMSYSTIGVILEIEIYSEEITYSDKNDLLRLRDIYNRDKTTYEGSATETNIEIDNSVNFHIKNNFTIGDSNIQIKKYAKSEKYMPNNCVNTVNVLLDGKIINNNILTAGAIIDSSRELQFISTEFTIMTIQNTYCNENAKIIYSKEHLTDILNSAPFYNIGLTSGCFDILHKGHINNLKLSKNMCNTLFVCLSSDEQIKNLKGDSRPVNNITDRMRMLSHMYFIDYIILYDEIDNATEKELDNIMNILKPDYWFKGTDYTEEQIRIKHPTLKNIQLFDNISNVSTTGIINKIVSIVSNQNM